MTDRLRPDLEDRLAEIADRTDGSDWLDVERRAVRIAARRRRGRLVVVLVAAVLVLVALAVVPAFGIGSRLLAVFGVEEEVAQEVPTPRGSAAVAPAAYVYGDTLFGIPGGPQKLRGALTAMLLGQEASLVVPSPEGRWIAYYTSPNFTPTLRVHDIETKADVVLARGAHSIAWARDGRIAYFRAEPPRYDPRRPRGPYFGRVFVRESLDRREIPWTRSVGEYHVLAWAGRSLLVDVGRCVGGRCRELPSWEISAFEAPGQSSALGIHTLSAVSPDGRYVLGGYLPVPGQDSPSPFVRVVAVKTARVVAHVDLRSVVDESVPRDWVSGGIGSASWVGNRIVAVGYGDDPETGAAVSALLFFRFAGDRLRVEQVIRLDEQAGLDRGRGTNFRRPLFLDDKGERVVVRVTAPLTGSDGALVVFLTCDRTTGRCARGRPLPVRRWLAIVHNPSRPIPNRGFLRP